MAMGRRGLGVTPMRKHLLLLALLPLAVRAASPAFTDFDTTQFGTTGNKVAIKSGATTTNLTDKGQVTALTFAGNAGVITNNVLLTYLSFSNTAAPPTANRSDTGFDNNAWAVGRGALQVNDGTEDTYVLAALRTNTPAAGQTPIFNGAGTILWGTPAVPAGTASASGTANTVAKFTSTTNLGNSSITDNGTAVTMTEPLLFSADNTVDIGSSNATRARLIFAGTSFRAPDGSSAAPGFAFQGSTNTGMYRSGSDVGFLAGGTDRFRVISGGGVDIGPTLYFGNVIGNQDTPVNREGAAIVQMGDDRSAPIAQTFKGPDARAGTDTNAKGGDMTIAAGRNTGTNYGGTLYFATALPGSTGTAAGTLTNGAWLGGTNGNFSVNAALVLSAATQTNQYTDNGTTLLRNGVAISGETTATNIVTLTMTGTNVSAMDYSLVQRGGVFKLVLTGTAFIGAPSGVANTSFTKATLMVQQPSTGTCALTFTNGFYAFPEGVAPIIDTNNGAVTVFEFKSDVFTNGLLHGWMSLKSKLIP
jgi:hypothetical protein